MEEIILFSYITALTILFIFGSHGFVMIYYYLKFKSRKQPSAGTLESYPVSRESRSEIV